MTKAKCSKCNQPATECVCDFTVALAHTYTWRDACAFALACAFDIAMVWVAS